MIHIFKYDTVWLRHENIIIIHNVLPHPQYLRLAWNCPIRHSCKTVTFCFMRTNCFLLVLGKVYVYCYFNLIITELTNSVLYFSWPQATWCTALHMMTSLTTDGPPDTPLGHICHWRILNLTPGNTSTWRVLIISLCAYGCMLGGGADLDKCTVLSGSVICSVMSHMGVMETREWTLQTMISFVARSDLHMMLRMWLPGVQVLGYGLSVFIYVGWVFIS